MIRRISEIKSYSTIMHKSIIFMVGLLVVLMPIGSSMNILSNIMAIEEYGYEANPYDQSYNSQGSDYINKIKCNNNNININGENNGDINLGNDDQEAAAGSYVGGNAGEEYNKKGFDCVTNNNDNIVQGGTGQSGKGAQGPTGPQGPQGVQGQRGFNGTQGPQGIQGPSGITQLNDTNTYLVTNTTVNTFVASKIGQAICDPEDFVVNGGFSILTFNVLPSFLFEHLNRAILTPLASGWEVGINPTTQDGFVQYEVYAICFDNQPLRMSLAATSTYPAVQQQSADPPMVSQEIKDSLTKAQAIENSPKLTVLEKQPADLTAMEKITKLKTQWLNQLP